MVQSKQTVTYQAATKTNNGLESVSPIPKRGRAGKSKKGQETEHWAIKKACIWYTTDP